MSNKCSNILFSKKTNTNSIYLKKLENYYNNIIPSTCKHLCNTILDNLDYNNFCINFSKNWPIGKEGGFITLWNKLIQIVLNTTITWPDDKSISPIKISELPTEDKEMIIDYIGYLIGIPQGQGHSLIKIYKKYYST